MSQLRRPGTSLFTINRPEWQANLPRGLRIAAEWQFGTIVLSSIIGSIRGDLVGLPVGLFISFILFLFLSGWAESRRINSPGLWWAVVITLSLLGALAVVGVVTVDPGS
jgi:hypothetical protein